jgi:rare lipoprotein A
MKRILLVFVTGFVAVVLCSAQARTAEINRGIFYQEGIASWYGGEFNGRPTASGEIFDDTKLTAAHPILPFGTVVKVTNQHNNKSVTVRINDRGPFVAARVIDLSRAAAEQIDMIKTGTAPVKIESLHEVSLQQRPAATSAPLLRTTPPSDVPASTAVSPAAVTSAAIPASAETAPVIPAPAVSTAPVISAAPVSAPPAPSSGTLPANPGETVQLRPASVEPYSSVGGSSSATGFYGAVVFHPAIPQTITGKQYRVQVGAYKQPEYAADAFEKLRRAGLNPAYERYGEYYRVVIAGLPQSELQAVSERLHSAGFRDVLLREE